MKLKQLRKFEQITIQCHDNPDADSIGAGFALYCYFKSFEKEVSLIYSGRNKIQKANLVLMIEKLQIPIEYRDKSEQSIQGLLITVDCQYGAGNVTKFEAEEIAIIDHHQIEITDIPFSEINVNLGSCSTLVWKMLREEQYDFDSNILVGTALYFGLYSDTNQLSEIYNPLDMDMRDNISCNKSLITLFRNSNISLKEFELAGVAMIRYIYNDDHDYAIIKAQPCDPNILGLISDFLLQVDEIFTCVVYNEVDDGFKLSVRSCIKEVRASELAAFLTQGIGSGGGHVEKAGGFISKIKYEEKYPTLHTESYFGEKMNAYFDNTDIIYAKDYEMKTTGMKQYRRRKIELGYVKTQDVMPIGSPITIRTLEGDLKVTVEEGQYLIIGIKGDVNVISKKQFEKRFIPLEHKFSIYMEYIPTIRSKTEGKVTYITEYANSCVSSEDILIYAKKIKKTVKVFPLDDEEKYMLGKIGDYMAIRCDNLNDIYIIEKEMFQKSYEKL